MSISLMSAFSNECKGRIPRRLWIKEVPAIHQLSPSTIIYWAWTLCWDYYQFINEFIARDCSTLWAMQKRHKTGFLSSRSFYSCGKDMPLSPWRNNAGAETAHHQEMGTLRALRGSRKSKSSTRHTVGTSKTLVGGLSNERISGMSDSFWQRLLASVQHIPRPLPLLSTSRRAAMGTKITGTVGHTQGHVRL